MPDACSESQHLTGTTGVTVSSPGLDDFERSKQHLAMTVSLPSSWVLAGACQAHVDVAKVCYHTHVIQTDACCRARLKTLSDIFDRSGQVSIYAYPPRADTILKLASSICPLLWATPNSS